MRFAFLLTLLVTFSLPAITQEPTAQEPKTPAFVPPSVRLTGAKAAFVKPAEGNEIPYNVITDGLEGWGRYALVSSPKEADIVIEIYAPDDNSTTTISSSSTDQRTGKPENSVGTSRNLSSGSIRMIVKDAKSGMVLWTGSEQPKSGFKKKAQEDHLVAASEKLLSKFRDRVEPPPAQ